MGDRNDDRVRVARVGKTHGVDGSFYVEGAIAPKALTIGARVWIGTDEHEVVRRAGTDARPLMRVAAITNPETAKELRNAIIYMNRSELPELEDGEWYAEDLEGMQVWDSANQIGTVSRVVNMPSVDLIEVDQGEAAPALIPLLKDAIVEIDPTKRRITVDEKFLGLAK